MAVTYANETKKIVEIYSNERDQFGNDVERRLGFHLVYFYDVDNGTPALGPYIEPNRFASHDLVDHSFPGAGATTQPIDVINRQYFNNARGGGLLGFWKSPYI